MPRDWRISPHSETVSDQSRDGGGRGARRASAWGGWSWQQLRAVGDRGRNGAHVGRPRSGLIRLCTRRLRRRPCGAAAPRDTGSRRCSLAETGRLLSHASAAAHLGDQAKRGGRHRCDGAHRGPDAGGPACEFIAARGVRAGRDDRRTTSCPARPSLARSSIWRRVLRGRGLDAAIETSERLELLRPQRAIGILLGRHRRRGAAPGGCAGRSPLSTQSSFACAARPRRASTACASTPACRDRSSTGSWAQGERHLRGRSPLARRPGNPRSRQPVPRHDGRAGSATAPATTVRRSRSARVRGPKRCRGRASRAPPPRRRLDRDDAFDASRRGVRRA